MTILYVIIPIAIFLVSFFVWIFLWAVRNEQFDDLETPAYRILIDDWNDKLKETKIWDKLEMMGKGQEDERFEW
mgnify:CR=1 FL=1